MRASASGAAALRIRHEDRGSTEERLRYHRELIDEIEAAVDAVKNDMAAQQRELLFHVSRMTDQLRGSIAEVDERHREVATSGLHLRLASVCALVLGIAMSTWSQELANLFENSA